MCTIAWTKLPLHPSIFTSDHVRCVRSVTGILLIAWCPSPVLPDGREGHAPVAQPCPGGEGADGMGGQHRWPLPAHAATEAAGSGVSRGKGWSQMVRGEGGLPAGLLSDFRSPVIVSRGTAISDWSKAAEDCAVHIQQSKYYTQVFNKKWTIYQRDYWTNNLFGIQSFF